MTKNWPEHAEAAAGVVLYTFLANYLATPSAIGFLGRHSWLADLIGSALAAWHVYQSYSRNPNPPAPPVNEVRNP